MSVMLSSQAGGKESCSDARMGDRKPEGTPVLSSLLPVGDRWQALPPPPASVSPSWQQEGAGRKAAKGWGPGQLGDVGQRLPCPQPEEAASPTRWGCSGRLGRAGQSRAPAAGRSPGSRVVRGGLRARGWGARSVVGADPATDGREGSCPGKGSERRRTCPQPLPRALKGQCPTPSRIRRSCLRPRSSPWVGDPGPRRTDARPLAAPSFGRSDRAPSLPTRSKSRRDGVWETLRTPAPCPVGARPDGRTDRGAQGRRPALGVQGPGRGMRGEGWGGERAAHRQRPPLPS